MAIFKDKRKLFDRNLRKQERAYNRNIRDTIDTSNPTEFWNYLKRLGPRSHNPMCDTAVLDDGTEISDKTQLLAKWRSDFEKLFNGTLDINNYDNEFLESIEAHCREWDTHTPADDDISEDNELWTDMLNSPIDIAETTRALQRAKTGKSIGVDKLPNEVLKHPQLLYSLHRLYSACYDNNIVPSVWYQSIICPILKRGKDSKYPLNYRAICLMSTVAKVFSDIINNRIVYYMETRQLFADEQNGFRRMRSCIDHLYVLTSIIRNRKKDNLPTYVCYIDFTRAFDSVNHSLLWYKLHGLGISGTTLNIVRTMYRNLQSAVRVGHELTDWFSVTAGVRQGDNLAPTLFAIFVNDMVSEINSLNKGLSIGDRRVSCLLYADDIVLMSDTPDNLQDILNTVYSWCSKWRLGVNMSKTKIMHFRKKSILRSNHVFSFGDNEIDYCDEYRYLGMQLNELLDYTHSANVLSDASSRALGAVISRYYATQGLNYKTFTKLYANLVEPVMDYASSIWGYKVHNKNNTTQHRAMRCFLGVGKFTAIPALYGELCWKTPLMRHHVDMIRLFTRLTNMDKSRLTYQTFKWEYDRQRAGTWCYEIKNILSNCDLLDYYNGHRSMYRKNIIAEVSRNLCVKQIEEWEIARNMPKLVNYNKFKSEFSVPKYIMYNLTIRERSSIAKLYCGNLIYIKSMLIILNWVIILPRCSRVHFSIICWFHMASLH